MAIVLSVLLFTASDYHFGILWPLYYLSFYLRLLITTLVSCGHCIISPSIYGLWLPLWCLVAIVLSDLLFTASDYHFGILWPLHYLSFYIRLLMTTLVSCGHCIICPSIYGFWLPLWYLVAIVLSDLLFTASDYHFGILWPLYYLSFYLRFWWPLWYLVAILLAVLLFTASDYHFDILWPLYSLSFYLRLLITTLVSCGHCIITLDYHFGILWPLYYLSFWLFTALYFWWLPLWYLVYYLTISITTLVSCGPVLLFTASDYHFVLSVLLFVITTLVYWPLYYLSFYLRLLITTLVSCGHCIIYPFISSDYHFGHCIICPSIYGFWLPLWYLAAMVLSVLLFTASDYHFGILWPFLLPLW